MSSDHVFQQAAGLFIDRLSQPSKLQQIMDRTTTPEQRADIEAEQQAVSARYNAARASLAHQLSPEFLEILADAARLIGQNDEGDTVVSVRALFEMAKDPMPNIERTDFSTPGWRDPRFDNRVDFSIQRPEAPILRCDDLCGGTQP